MAESPKTRLLARIDSIEVWEVDGSVVRRDIDPDFVNFGQHYHYHYIPANEFWIDRERSHDEVWFFITHLLTEHKAMARGTPYAHALALGDRAEAAERFKSERYEEAKKHDEPAAREIYKEQLATLGDVTVWLVDGEMVRDLYRIDFTAGGHGYVYTFIPLKEIWIDDDISPDERFYTIVHEFLERKLMIKGKKYHPAHRAATKVEWMLRNAP